jgi:vacuolar-type H+-ATPase subunit C/Vma6
MRRIAAGAIDLRNARAAITLAAEPQDQPIEAAFLSGGTRLDRADFVAASQADGAAGAAAALSATLGSRTLAVVLRRHAAEPGRLDDAILAWRIGRLARRIRIDPLGPEPVIHFLLRLRRQVVALRRLVWSAALGAPVAPGHLVEAV